MPPPLALAHTASAAARTAPAPLRHLASSSASLRPQPIGARVDTSTRYTDTGGSGAESTALSASPAERSARVRALYRRSLRAIPAARNDFNLAEDGAFLGAMVRDLFVARAAVSDAKVLDMLVFKGVQEVQEFELQFKSRTYVRNAIDRFAQGVRARQAPGVDAERTAMLEGWKGRGLVPAEVQSWGEYERWKKEEKGAFAQFAEDAGLFDKSQVETIERKKAQCSVM